MHKNYDRERAVAIAAVRKACRVTAAVHHRLVEGQTLTKNDRSPVTVADFASQAIIIHELGMAFPEDVIVGEEDSDALRASGAAAQQLRDNVESLVNTANDAMPLSMDEILSAIDRGNYAGGASGRHWTLDPIDGTKGFVRGEQYAVCLALIEEGEVVLGVLGCPHLPAVAGEQDSAAPGCLLVSTIGCGSTMQPINASVSEAEDPPIAVEDEVAVSVSKVAELAEARFCESVEAGHSSHSDASQIADRLGIVKEPVRLDSQCKYAVVARGEASIYLRLPTRIGYFEKIWDHASGYLIVKEAGGQVTDVRGRTLDFSRGRTLALNTGIVATNGILHSRVLEAVRAVLYPVNAYYVTIEGRNPPAERQLEQALADALGIDADLVTVEVCDDEESDDSSEESDDDSTTEESDSEE